MAYKKIEITDEHIKLLQAMKFEEFVFDEQSRNGRIGWGIDQYSPWGGNYPIEDIALILGHWEEAIPGSENTVEGRCFPEPLQSHLLDLYEFITENMPFLWSMVIWYSDKGGLTAGTYKCNPRYLEWQRVV